MIMFIIMMVNMMVVVMIMVFVMIMIMLDDQHQLRGLFNFSRITAAVGIIIHNVYNGNGGGG